MQFSNYLPAVIARTVGKFKNCLKTIAGRQTLRIMKLTAILLTIAFLHVKADVLSQTVTISGKKILLEKVFTTIKQQTGYIFFYTTDIIGDAPKVSLHVKNASVEEVLKLALKNQQLSYHIENKTIIISKKEGEDNKQQNEAVPPPGDVKGQTMAHLQTLIIIGVVIIMNFYRVIEYRFLADTVI